jgi:glutamate synthase domain-containing protein 3
MTGGRVIVLGSTGVNFAAGMSGGIAYVYDPQHVFASKCNHELVGLEKLDDDTEINYLSDVIREHMEYTGSTVAERILGNWEAECDNFVKVFPHDYKAVSISRCYTQG